MSGVVGGMSYGGYGGDTRGSMGGSGGKYESYDSKNYGKSETGSYNNSSLGGYGKDDYTYKSTLDKYKDPATKITSNSKTIASKEQI
jgi:hypothetical protein